MLPILLLAAAAAPQTPIDAERAFASDAKMIGQWTAFRKWSTDDAVMFVPQPINTHEFLKDRKDPPKVIDWWPTASYISCDGKVAVNTGGWKRPDGNAGYFTTVWQRQAGGGWKWIVDGGDGLKTARPRPANPKVVRAACRPHLFNLIVVPGSGISPDDSMRWSYEVKPDGSRRFTAEIQTADGKRKTVINDVIPAPK